MGLKDMLLLAGAVLSGEVRKTYWMRNEDGTISIWVAVYPTGDASPEMGSKIAKAAQSAAQALGDKAVSLNGDSVLDTGVHVGADESNSLRAVGMARVPDNAHTHEALSRMKLRELV
jgi:hypothetical protein